RTRGARDRPAGWFRAVVVMQVVALVVGLPVAQACRGQTAPAWARSFFQPGAPPCPGRGGLVACGARRVDPGPARGARGPGAELPGCRRCVRVAAARNPVAPFREQVRALRPA